MPLALIIGITAPTGDDCRPNFDSRNQPRNNGSGIVIPEVDKLFDQGLAEPDPAKQKMIYSKLAKILSDEIVNVWIGTFTAPNVASKKVKNLTSIGYWDVLQRLNEVWLSA
jgi:ABC-type transport system substrate-binding protein